MANTAARFHFTPVEKSTCPGYDKEVLIQLKSGPAKSPYSGALYVMPSIVDLKANLGEAARIGHLQRFVDAKAAIDLITGSPQNLSLDAIAEARLMAYIYTLFAAGGRYDYQRILCGEFVKTYTPFASFHFGLFMATAKFPTCCDFLCGVRLLQPQARSTSRSSRGFWQFQGGRGQSAIRIFCLSE